MKKLPTLFPKDPKDLAQVINGEPLFPLSSLKAYLKIDGTACAVIEGKPYFRYDARLRHKGRTRTVEQVLKTIPAGAIACQAPDPITGHWPHWIPPQKGDRIQNELAKVCIDLEDGTYEGIGPLIQGNPHNEPFPMWIKHNDPKLLYPLPYIPFPYSYFKELFKDFQWEGLVFYKEQEPVAKLRRSDYNYGRYNSVSLLLTE